MAFSGLGLHLGNLSRLSNAQTRSISPENLTGDKGKGGMSTDGPAAAQGRDPADLDDARARTASPFDPARLLGRPGAAERGMPGR